MESKDKEALASRLGAKIAELRLNADMTQADLAASLGIGDEAVSRFERGTVLPTLPRLCDIAEVFRRGVDELLVGASPRLDDQALSMAYSISRLSQADRSFISDMVDRLASHLAGKDAEKPKRR